MPTTLTQKTIYRNTSGTTRYFAYLGKVGLSLADDEDVAIEGTVYTLHGRNQVMLDSFQNDLDSGAITILKTPDVFCYDATAEKVLVLGADNGDPVAVAADYGSYDGPEPDL
jgi:hypothetical protein